MKPIVWVADIGSIQRQRFGWCRNDRIISRTGTDIAEFAEGIAKDLSDNQSVAVGFECPLFVPIADSPQHLTKARHGEGNRPWCAGAGSGALTIGLTECVWVFEKINALVGVVVHPTFDWQAFAQGRANLFIWEAMVSRAAKGKSHSDDAEIAAQSFWQHYPAIGGASSVTATRPYSLVGAGLLRGHLSTDLQLLFEPCIVIAG